MSMSLSLSYLESFGIHLNFKLVRVFLQHSRISGARGDTLVVVFMVVN